MTALTVQLSWLNLKRSIATVIFSPFEVNGVSSNRDQSTVMSPGRKILQWNVLLAFCQIKRFLFHFLMLLADLMRKLYGFYCASHITVVHYYWLLLLSADTKRIFSFSKINKFSFSDSFLFCFVHFFDFWITTLPHIKPVHCTLYAVKDRSHVTSRFWRQKAQWFYYEP